MERDHTDSFVHAEVVIGRDDDKKKVVDHLMDSKVEVNVSILPIVGIGGLGKTTLAQLIFNDEQVQKHFELKMWVCVSDTFDVKNIVEKVLESATKKKPKKVEMDTLIGYLKKEINEKKYLLVLDQVWNEDRVKWSRLRDVLMCGAKGSRILVTTRNEIVASTIRSKSVEGIIGTAQSYFLRGLNEDASWCLFKEEAFENGQEPENSSIVALGREILEKCSGVPLAIRTIGSLLGSKNRETEWLTFKNNELLKIFQNETDILPTLKLSYDHLPSHLKHCFAYCSLFPKHCKIQKSTLIKLWIAQGFVKLSDQNRCLEDVANEYFMDLLWRSFFQEAEMDRFGNVIQCKMHDLMHDLAIVVAGSLIIRLDDKARNVDEKTRHISVVGDCNVSFSSISTSLCKARRTRTLLCDQDFWIEDCYANFSSFMLLRVLTNPPLKCPFEKLKHLRYLDLSNNFHIKKLPNSITKLQNLQTLRLLSCRSLEELPRDIKMLVNLRHLEIDGCSRLNYMPRGLGQLTNLQTLSKFVLRPGFHSKHNSGLQELNGLNNLRGKLEIQNWVHEKGIASEYKAANIKEKQHLHDLHLIWFTEGDVRDSDIVEDEASLESFQPHPNLKQLELTCYRGLRFPSWLLLLTNLVTFQLNGCNRCQCLPPLSQLPSLKELFLINLEAIEYISDDGDSNEFSSSSTAPTPFFPSLKYIQLYNCPNLKGWWRRDSSVEVNSDSHNSIEITEHHRLLSSFPCLSILKIEYCPMLTSMPMFPHLEEELVLTKTSSKPLQQTMMMNMAAPQRPTSTATDSSSFTPLSKLKSISFVYIEDLETLPLQNLTSLVHLRIHGCNRLKSLSQGVKHLTALQDLVLENCRDLELGNDEDGMQWQDLKSLLFVHFIFLPKLESLPSWLQHATSLQELEIADCENLTAIPEWIHKCTSLEVVAITQCWILASLPEGMRRLKSLRMLFIWNCPLLWKRCKRNLGEDWAKIAHIPELYLR
jgi:Leucine-rich repeat (LRR) protein